MYVPIGTVAVLDCNYLFDFWLRVYIVFNMKIALRCSWCGALYIDGLSRILMDASYICMHRIFIYIYICIYMLEILGSPVILYALVIYRVSRVVLQILYMYKDAHTIHCHLYLLFVTIVTHY